MMKKIQKIIYTLLTIALIFSSIYSYLPQKALADIPDEYNQPQNTPFAQLTEVKYISDFLQSKGVLQFDIQNLIDHLWTNDYFSKTPAAKKAFLHKGIREKQLYYWRILPYVFQVEVANNWNARTARNTDWYTDKCFDQQIQNDSLAAAQFFVRNWCGINPAGNASHANNTAFYDKTKWMSSQLDILYSQYWPHLANYRYRPYFTEQEIANLKAFVGIIFQGKNISDRVGAFCDKLNDPGLKDLSPDVAIMLAMPLAGRFLRGGYTIAASTAEAIADLNEYSAAEKAKMIREVLGPLAKTFNDDALIRSWEQEGSNAANWLAKNFPALVRRWGSSGISSSQWHTLDTNAEVKFINAATEGRFPAFPTRTAARNFYRQHLRFVQFSNPGDAGIAPRVVDGQITEPMRISSKFIDNDPAFREIVAHESKHYHNYRVYGNIPRRGTPDEALIDAMRKIGMKPHNPLPEALTDYFSNVNIGNITFQEIKSPVTGYPSQYREIVDDIVQLIVDKTGRSWDQAVNYLHSQFLRNDYTQITNEVFRGQGWWFTKINDLLGCGAWAEAKAFISGYY